MTSQALSGTQDENRNGPNRVRRDALPVLTSLRFFAAAEVVVFHMTVNAPRSVIPDGLLRDLASGGYAAVTFFFVLSGFILTYAHAGATDRAGCNVEAPVFWRLRFARLAPAYYLGLLFTLPVIQNFVATVPDTASAVAGPALVMLFLQSWWPPFATLWNFPAWSLSVECLFYAVFPWLSRHSARVPRPALFVLSYSLIVAVAVYRAEFVRLSDILPDNRADLLFQSYFPLLHLPLFVFGMVLGRQFLFGRLFSVPAHSTMLYAGLALLIGIFAGKPVLPWWAHSDGVLAAVFALVIFGGAGAAPAVPLLAHPALVLLGEASYAMYILHIPVRFYWKLTTVALGIDLPLRLYMVLYFIIVVAVSVLVFRYVETPLRRRIAPRPFR